METIRLYQYRADKQDNHKIDDIIAWWTGIWNPGTPPYSHSECGFNMAILNEPLDWLMFSSTTRGKWKGVRFAKEEKVLIHPERWDIYECKVEYWRRNEILRRCRSIEGLPYDWPEVILGYIEPIGWLHSKNKWSCSAAVHYVLTGKRIRVSPRRLLKKLKQAGLKFEVK